MNDPLIERMTEIAHRDSAVSVTVRADDLRALLSKLRATIADERPLGAIINGRMLAERLEAYPFESDGGNLRLCSDWVEFRRCFEYLAELTSAPVAGEAIAYAIHNIDLKGDVRVYAVKPWAGPDSMQDDAGWGDRWAGNRPLVYGDAAPQVSEAVQPDQPDIETLRRVGAAHDAVEVCPECDIAGCKHMRAALSAQPGAKKNGPTSE